LLDTQATFSYNGAIQKGILVIVRALILQAISKMQITFKDKARADEKAQHTWEHVSILKRLATP
jgi:hypothetical protein